VSSAHAEAGANAQAYGGIGKMFTGIGFFPAIDLAFNFSLILTALIAIGLTAPDFNHTHISK
jgi:hypothetical protein